MFTHKIGKALVRKQEEKALFKEYDSSEIQQVKKNSSELPLTMGFTAKFMEAVSTKGFVLAVANKDNIEVFRTNLNPIGYLAASANGHMLYGEPDRQMMIVNLLQPTTQPRAIINNHISTYRHQRSAYLVHDNIYLFCKLDRYQHDEMFGLYEPTHETFSLTLRSIDTNMDLASSGAMRLTGEEISYRGVFQGARILEENILLVHFERQIVLYQIHAGRISQISTPYPLNDCPPSLITTHQGQGYILTRPRGVQGRIYQIFKDSEGNFACADSDDMLPLQTKITEANVLPKEISATIAAYAQGYLYLWKKPEPTERKDEQHRANPLSMKMK